MVVGPTAVGKSWLALALARRLGNAEILSVDSMQVYRGMDIGTAKPTAAERAQVQHHLIDLIDPHETMDIVDFARAHDSAMADMHQRSRQAVLAGGTGLYIRAVVDRLEPPPRYPEVMARLENEPDTVGLHHRLRQVDPTAAARMEPNNRRRVLRALEVSLGSGRPFSSFGPGMTHYPPVPHLILGVDAPRDVLDRRIDVRYDQQMQQGLLAEVEGLLNSSEVMSHTARQALGYKELAEHLEGAISLDEALDTAKRRTRRFARRQQRWFRRDPRIVWLEHQGSPEPLEEVAWELVERHLDHK